MSRERYYILQDGASGNAVFFYFAPPGEPLYRLQDTMGGCSPSRLAKKARGRPRLGVVAGGLVLWCLSAQAGVTSDPGTFIPPQATVVLMTGLPGDIESENTYR